MAVGLTMAQQIMRQPAAAAGSAGTIAPAGAVAPAQAPAAALDVLGPAEVATMLNVTEADVIASLDAGDLKGKRIGSQWRVTRSAVEQFMQNP
jgi:excisionase family DNA binding protein